MAINVGHGETSVLEGALQGVSALGPGMREAKQNELLDLQLQSAGQQVALDQANADRAQQVAEIAKQRRIAAQLKAQAQGALGQEVSSGTSWDELGQIALSAGLAPALGPISSIGLEEGKDYPSVVTPQELSRAADLANDPKEYAKFVQDLTARQAQIMSEAENAAVGELAQEMGAKGVLSPEEVNKYVQQLAAGDATAANVFQALTVRQKYAKGLLKKQRSQTEAQATIEALASPEWKNSASKEDKEYVADIQAEFDSGGTLLEDPDELVAKVKVRVLGLEQYHEQEKAKARAEGMHEAMQAMAQEFSQGFPMAGLMGPGGGASGSAQDASSMPMGQEPGAAAMGQGAAPAPATQPAQGGDESAAAAKAAELYGGPSKPELPIGKNKPVALRKVGQLSKGQRASTAEKFGRFFDEVQVKLRSGNMKPEEANAAIEAYVRDELRLDVTPEELKALLKGAKQRP